MRDMVLLLQLFECFVVSIHTEYKQTLAFPLVSCERLHMCTAKHTRVRHLGL